MQHNNKQQNHQADSRQEEQMENIEYLQGLVEQLMQANDQLREEVQYLREELSKSLASTQSQPNDESQMALDFTQIERLLKDYRAELEKYQSSLTHQLKEKNTMINDLSKELETYSQKNQEQLQRIQKFENEMMALQQSKNSLLDEIIDIQRNRRGTTEDTSRSKKSSKWQDQGFQANIQAQLEKLIEKLIKELQHQRSIKKRLNDQIKRLQSELTNLQKESIVKNNKIYQLQLQILRSTKAASPTFPQAKKIQFSKQGSNYTLMELVNGSTIITARQKLIICLRIIDLFIRKITAREFSQLILQSIKVFGINTSNPDLITARPTRDSQTQLTSVTSEAEIIWNLAFLLDNIYALPENQKTGFGELSQEADAMELVTQMLESKEGNSLSLVLELREIVQKAKELRS